jgi:hypothetical protein
MVPVAALPLVMFGAVFGAAPAEPAAKQELEHRGVTATKRCRAHLSKCEFQRDRR